MRPIIIYGSEYLIRKSILKKYSKTYKKQACLFINDLKLFFIDGIPKRNDVFDAFFIEEINDVSNIKAFIDLPFIEIDNEFFIDNSRFIVTTKSIKDSGFNKNNAILINANNFKNSLS